MRGGGNFEWVQYTATWNSFLDAQQNCKFILLYAFLLPSKHVLCHIRKYVTQITLPYHLCMVWPTLVSMASFMFCLPYQLLYHTVSLSRMWGLHHFCLSVSWNSSPTTSTKHKQPYHYSNLCSLRFVSVPLCCLALLITPLQSYLAHLQFTEAQQAVVNINSYI